ncbi:MAG: hypothetical protein P1V97_30395 [Planctomycetota bacterium]|nr:hypothetical protein [Planctomycetota bacterium]
MAESAATSIQTCIQDIDLLLKLYGALGSGTQTPDASATTAQLSALKDKLQLVASTQKKERRDSGRHDPLATMSQSVVALTTALTDSNQRFVDRFKRLEERLGRHEESLSELKNHVESAHEKTSAQVEGLGQQIGDQLVSAMEEQIASVESRLERVEEKNQRGHDVTLDLLQSLDEQNQKVETSTTNLLNNQFKDLHAMVIGTCKEQKQHLEEQAIVPQIMDRLEALDEQNQKAEASATTLLNNQFKDLHAMVIGTCKEQKQHLEEQSIVPQIMDRLDALSLESQTASDRQEHASKQAAHSTKSALQGQLKQLQETLTEQIADFETLTLSSAKQSSSDNAEAMEKLKAHLESSHGQLGENLTGQIEQVIHWQQKHRAVELLTQSLSQLDALNQRILADSKDQKNFLVQVVLAKINEQFTEIQSEAQKLGAQAEKINQDSVREHGRQIDRTAGLLRNDIFKKLNEVIQRQHSNNAVKSLLESAAGQKTALAELKEYSSALEQMSAGIRKRLDLSYQGINTNGKKADSIIKNNADRDKIFADFGVMLGQIADDFPEIIDGLKEILYSQFLELSNRFQMQDARFSTLHKIVASSTPSRRSGATSRPSQRPGASPSSSATRAATKPSPAPAASAPPPSPRSSGSKAKASPGTAPTKSFERGRVAAPRDPKPLPRDNKAKAPSDTPPPRPRPKAKPGGRMESDLNFVDEI